MGQFEIHRQLQSDTYDLGRFPLCRILLHRNGALPWFILVPETDAIDFARAPTDLLATTETCL